MTSLSSLGLKEPKVGPHRFPGRRKNRLEERKFLLAKDLLHRFCMLEVAPEILNGPVIMGVDDNRVRNIDGFIARFKDPFRPFLILRKFQSLKWESFPNLLADTRSGIGEPDKRIRVSLVLRISYGHIDPFLLARG